MFHIIDTLYHIVTLTARTRGYGSRWNKMLIKEVAEIYNTQ